MIKKITNSITRSPIKPFVNSAKKFLEIINKPKVTVLDKFDKSKSAIQRNLLERKIAHLEKLIKQMQKMNKSVEGEIRYRDKLKKDLENFDRRQKIPK